MAIKAIIFDLDGTIIDSEALFVQVLQTLSAKGGHRLTTDELNDICWGRSWQGIYKELIKCNKTSYTSTEQMVAAVDEYIEKEELQFPPIAGSVNLLKRLS